jgi:ParB-like chromosome segregation protein Spo0J
MIDGSLSVLVGHVRIEAAKRLGIQEVSTISIQHLSESQRRAFVIADNCLAEQRVLEAPGRSGQDWGV